jgi:DNA (cytosine-5)-methyltransferase 3A
MQPSGLFGDLESIIEQPKDRGILLKDVLESEVDEKYFLSEISTKKILKYNNSERSLNNDGKSICLQAGYSKIGHDNQFVVNKQFTGLDLNAKSRTIRNGGSATATDKHNWDLIVHNTMPRSSTSGKGGTGHLSRNDGKTYCLDTGNTNAVEIVAMRGRGEKGNIEQQLETNGTNKSNSLTTVTKDNLVFNYRQDAPNDINGKKDCLRANAGGVLKGVGIIERSRIRRLTPIECERLQTVAENYTNHVSDSQRYKMLGNGWTIEVIIHILKYITL